MADKDFVQTPKEITEILLSLETFKGDILEPCCGKGAISEVLKSKGYNVISSDVKDYGYGKIEDLFNIDEEYDNIITNPPFSGKLANPIQRKLMSITKDKLVLIYYVKNIGAILEGKASKYLKTIYILNKRIDWVETKLGWLFAWYVWEKGYEGDITIKRIDLEQPIVPNQNSPSASANAEDLICVKEEFQK